MRLLYAHFERLKGILTINPSTTQDYRISRTELPIAVNRSWLCCDTSCKYINESRRKEILRYSVDSTSFEAEYDMIEYKNF